ncbi:MAG: hypothetical protein WDO70_06715 [Alphaproteobacteria bacterium]
MSNPLPPELFPDPALKPPRRSRPKLTLRQRRGIILIAASLLCFAGGGIYEYVSGLPSTPREIPLIMAERGPVKQRPAAPGGIDVPHQDVTIFDRLGQKEEDSEQVEHLLPPPEAPNEHAVQAPIEVVPPPPSVPVPSAEKPSEKPPEKAPEKPAVEPPVVSPPSQSPPAAVLPAVVPPPITVPAPLPEKVVTPASQPQPAPQPAPQPISQPPAAGAEKTVPAKEKPKEKIAQEKPAKQKPAPVPVKPVKPLIRPPAPPPPNPAKAETGQTRIQLAAFPDSARAQEKLMDIVTRHAGMLRSVKLSVVKSGGSYRIQSQPLPSATAQKVCADLRAAGAGCLIAPP